MIDKKAAAMFEGFSVKPFKNIWYLTKDRKTLKWKPFPTEEAAWDFAFDWILFTYPVILHEVTTNRVFRPSGVVQSDAGPMALCIEYSLDGLVWAFPLDQAQGGLRFVQLQRVVERPGPWGSRS